MISSKQYLLFVLCTLIGELVCYKNWNPRHVTLYHDFNGEAKPHWILRSKFHLNFLKKNTLAKLEESECKKEQFYKNISDLSINKPFAEYRMKIVIKSLIGKRKIVFFTWTKVLNFFIKKCATSILSLIVNNNGRPIGAFLNFINYSNASNQWHCIPIRKSLLIIIKQKNKVSEPITDEVNEPSKKYNSTRTISNYWLIFGAILLFYGIISFSKLPNRFWSGCRLLWK